MDEPRWRVKSPLAAIAISLAGIVILLGAAVGAQLFLAYEISLWESAAEKLPAPLKYFGYVGGVVVAVLVGFVAPPVGRLGRAFEGKFAPWLVSFIAGMAAMVVALGAGLFATKCLPWGRGLEGLLSLALHFLALAAMVFGGWGAVKAIKG
ncbi:MAG: hypothetical protein JSU81_03520 [Candidatus Coatesbacteria bacterium]|nr:MAG: hypothetical protein JSU81_03520 [Candidatus Coatesbacteria bacterium]